MKRLFGTPGLARRVALALCVCLAVIALVLLGSQVPNADWFGQYDAAARGILRGRSPYEQAAFSNPPWTALVLVPFVILPPNMARGLVLASTVAAWLYIGWRLRAPRLAMLALLLSPTAIDALLAANVDAFAMLGAFLPAAGGVFLLMMKPQVGLGAVLYELHGAWQRGKIWQLVRTFGPIVLALAISLIFFRDWLVRMTELIHNGWNRSLFPYMLPLGIGALWLGIRRRNVMFALAASPFLSPYLTFPSYIVVQMGLLHEDVEHVMRRDLLQALICAGLWVLVLHFKVS
jgi:hypothetical protein